jgi:putative hydrolase of the HAD superfamily
VDNYAQLKLECLEFFPEAKKILETLQKRGTRLALLTNGEAIEQRTKITRLGLERYFPVCLIEGELGFGKPDRQVFEAAITRLQVDPEHTWMVGDNLARDIAGAQQLGISAIWYDLAKKGLPKESQIKPDRIIHSLNELLA